MKSILSFYRTGGGEARPPCPPSGSATGSLHLPLPEILRWYSFLVEFQFGMRRRFSGDFPEWSITFIVFSENINIFLNITSDGSRITRWINLSFSIILPK